MSREIYWLPDVPDEDLKAQVLLALVQLECIKRPEIAQEWLSGYVRRNFRIPLNNATTALEADSARAAISFMAAARLIQRWCFPEDFRSFRQYVKAAVRCASREYLGSADSGCYSLSTLSGDADGNGSIEPCWDHAEGFSVPQLSLSNSTPILRERCELMTIEHASEFLGVSPSYLYRLVRLNRLPAIENNGAKLLTGAEVDRLERIRQRRKYLQEQRKRFRLAGASSDAARKSAYRKFGSVPRI